MILPRVLILAGGAGSRSANPGLAKILQELAPGVTLLDHWIALLSNQGFSDFTFSLGHDACAVQAKLASLSLKFPMLKFQVHLDDSLVGTLRATAAAMDPIAETLVLTGDSFSMVDYRPLINGWRKSHAKVGFAVHNNGHEFDSDGVCLGVNDQAIHLHTKGASCEQEIDAPSRRFSLTGMVFIKQWAIPSEPGDLVQFLIRSTSLEDLKFQRFVGVSMDTGTPERLERARESYLWHNTRNRDKRFCVLDRDGTILPDIPSGRRRVQPTDVCFEDARAIGRLNHLGIPVFLVTNQPSIAKGQITFQDVEKSHLELLSALRTLGAWLDDIVYCPHHPESGFQGEVMELKIRCNCRKPASGMVTHLVQRFSLYGWSPFVFGDSDSDKGLSAAIGGKFFLTSYAGVSGPSLSDSISRFLEQK